MIWGGIFLAFVAVNIYLKKKGQANIFGLLSAIKKPAVIAAPAASDTGSPVIMGNSQMLQNAAAAPAGGAGINSIEAAGVVPVMQGGVITAMPVYTPPVGIAPVIVAAPVTAAPDMSGIIPDLSGGNQPITIDAPVRVADGVKPAFLRKPVAAQTVQFATLG